MDVKTRLVELSMSDDIPLELQHELLKMSIQLEKDSQRLRSYDEMAERYRKAMELLEDTPEIHELFYDFEYEGRKLYIYPEQIIDSLLLAREQLDYSNYDTDKIDRAIKAVTILARDNNIPFREEVKEEK